jgi:hypothetical protein
LTMGSTATSVLHASYNTGIGKLSLNSNTTGYHNSAVGNYSLRSNTTGYNNSALGYQSLYNNTTGNRNSAVGSFSLRSNTTGYQNSALGHFSLYSNTGGYQNSAVGSYSLRSNTTGYQNAAIGNFSLHDNTTGNQNSALGYQAGRYITGGATANETSDTSLYLGAETKALASGDENEIVIGYDTTGLGSNSVNLGNDSITLTALHGAVELDNDSWLRAKDYAGTGVVNMFKVNASNEIDVGGTLNIGTLQLAEDSGSVTLVNMPVSATPTAGDEMSYSFSVDSDVIAKVYAEADGSGGVDTKAVIIATEDLEVPSTSLSNGQTTFYLDETGDTLTVKCKYSDGTVKTGTIALS